MEGPREFTAPARAVAGTIHTVAFHEIGFLDLLAVRYYGPGYERMWWSIAMANAMIDPEREMFPGQQLLIPPRASVSQFLSRPGDAAGR